MEDRKFVCCICHNICSGYGNNPDGAAWRTEDGEVVLPEFNADDRCCDECNDHYVIIGRLYRMNHRK